MELKQWLVMVLAVFIISPAYAADHKIPDGTPMITADGADSVPSWDDSESAPKTLTLSVLKAWLDADRTVGFVLPDGGWKYVQRMVFPAGEDISHGHPVYIKAPATATQVFEYTAGATDADNDTYPVIGIAVANCASGASCAVWVGDCLLMRRDEATPVSADIGKALYPLNSAGAIGLVPNTTTGAHVERVGFFVGVNGFDSVTGDYILYRMPTASVVVTQ
jgi:hypothetical protein